MRVLSESVGFFPENGRFWSFGAGHEYQDD